MKLSLLIHNKKIFYTDQGHGTTLVLLHGYLESSDIWENFSKELSKSNRVLSFDIPGHGDSDVLAKQHTMQALAEVLKESLQLLHITKCFMVGHSMGGYLTLMFHELYPDLLSGFCLFHSHPFADTEETKKKRIREIEFIKDGKKTLIATLNIPNAFASDNLDQFKPEIEHAIQIAVKTPEEGIIANLYAMMNRPDLSESLANSKIPFLYLAGKKDNYIDFNTLIPKVKIPVNSELQILENSGHMGFIEEKKNALICIDHFIVQRIRMIRST